MNEEVKGQWLSALRSGEYKQGRQALCIVTEYGDEMCCLGVLCDLAVKAGVITAEPETVPDTLVHDGNRRDVQLRVYPAGDGGTEQSFPPDSVLKWAGLSDSDGYYDANPVVGGSTLSTWNDEKDANFAKIADLIEQYL